MTQFVYSSRNSSFYCCRALYRDKCFWEVVCHGFCCAVICKFSGADTHSLSIHGSCYRASLVEHGMSVAAAL
eukprot:1626395-Amphidinium_carterae.1